VQEVKGRIPLDSMSLESAVVAEAAGWATPTELATLDRDHTEWAVVLRRLLYDTDEAIKHAARSSGDEREQVLADLTQEQRQLAAALARLTGESVGVPATSAARRSPPAPEPPEPEEPGVALLQGSWADGRLVVWAGGPNAEPVGTEGLDELLRQADGASIGWERHGSVPLPGERPADARSAPIAQTLGWLVGIGAGQVAAGQTGGDVIGPSLRWLADAAVWGTELVAEGRMVPVLRTSTTSGSAGRGQGKHRVRWVPALSGRDRLAELATSMPGAVAALQPASQPDGLCRSVLSAVVDAVCRAGADRLVVPAAVPQASSRVEISEAILAGLGGRPFTADIETAGRLAEELKRWAAPVTVISRVSLTVRLDPPADDGGWLLRVEATGVDKAPLPVEHALVVASGTKSAQVEAQLRRLERLLPVLRRPSTRRGQVVLDGDEAAELMFNAGPGIVAAGFEVLLPLVSRRRPTPQLRMFAEAFGSPSQVGVAQLSNVRWSVLFDDLELDAADIARLASEARPLIQVKGRWVHVDRADLVAAAAALAERASITQLSGAALIRHAVGLEGSALGGPVRVDGSGWAVDLLRGATSNPPSPLPTPPGFKGQLRHYQAEAAGWLAFLDRAGLGGCLAMDMGLGKTPTVLAHLLAAKTIAAGRTLESSGPAPSTSTSGSESPGSGTSQLEAAAWEEGGPALVVCPPAVLSNWAAEAARFTPTLRVRVHHGPRRAEAAQLPVLASVADVVLTTYATAVRDIDALAKIEWRRIVVDEAQAIKNHQSETAQALRKLPQRSRLAMTGTPVENGLGDLWSILDFANPGLVGPRTAFVEHLSRAEAGAAPANGGSGGNGWANGAGTMSPPATVGARVAAGGTGAVVSAAPPVPRPEEAALRALNGLLVFRRTKLEPEIAAELPDKVDKLDHCAMTAEQVGLYQAVVDRLVDDGLDADVNARKGQVLAAITALKQICDHPAAYLGEDTDAGLAGRSGKLARLEEIVADVFAAGEKVLIFTHFARWGERLAAYLTSVTKEPVNCYHGGLSRLARDEMVASFQKRRGPGALVLSIKAGGSGLNLTAANHVVLYDRWWNPAVEDQARDRAWRIGQTSSVVSHRLVCPGTVDERVEEIVAGKRRVAGLVLPARSSLGDLDAAQIRMALGLKTDELIEDEPTSDAAVVAA
jgi:hypothetical protein